MAPAIARRGHRRVFPLRRAPLIGRFRRPRPWNGKSSSGLHDPPGALSAPSLRLERGIVCPDCLGIPRDTGAPDLAHPPEAPRDPVHRGAAHTLGRIPLRPGARPRSPVIWCGLRAPYRPHPSTPAVMPASGFPAPGVAAGEIVLWVRPTHTWVTARAARLLTKAAPDGGQRARRLESTGNPHGAARRPHLRRDTRAGPRPVQEHQPPAEHHPA